MGSLRTATACLALLLAALGAWAIPARAESAAAPQLFLEPEAPNPAEPRAVTAACTLEPGPIQTSFSWTWTTPDAFTTLAWRIPRASCATCGPTFGLAIKTISFRVRWFGPCAASAQVSVVGVTGPAGCRVPDPSHVLCGPTTYEIVGFTSAGAVYTLDLPIGCCVGPDAFVLVRFTGFDACYAAGTPSPGLTRTSAACVNCAEYFSTTVSDPSLTDWCTVAPTNSLWMQVEADCCGPVGVEGGSAMPPAAKISILGAPSRPLRMRISLPEHGPVELGVYDITGRKVRSLLRSELDGGDRFVDWDGTSDAGERMPAGVYKVRLRAGTASASATAVLLD